MMVPLSMSLKMYKRVFDGAIVELTDMLEAREKRSLRQQQLFAQFHHGTLLCATLNIPGPIKRSETFRLIFDQVMDEVLAQLDGEKILFQKQLDQKTGIEFYLMTLEEADTVKQKMMAIEQTQSIGRLFDLDVLVMINGQMKGLSRRELGLPTRRCLICEADAKECGRSRKHSVEEMQMKIVELIKEFVKEDEYGENPNN
ncbi:citrate lyase holo-[acyl-carrier protein] synthase [Globicatella sulfidifaciens]